MRYIIGLMCICVLGAACGATTAPESTSPSAVDAVETQAESPLEARLGVASDPGRRQAQLVALQREAGDELVQCMRSKGFFYVVGEAEAPLRGGVNLADGSRAWVSENGLGITSTLIDALTADARTTVPDAAETNLGYVGSLTPEQAAEYDVALVGEVGADPSAAEYEPAGCWGAAFDEILARLRVIELFGDKLDGLNTRLLSDPRVQRFESTWSQCMEAAGYRYASETTLSDDIYARLLAIELVDVDGVTSFASATEADELLVFERTVGLASYDCRQSFADEVEQLRHDYEREFLDDNRFLIADLPDP